MLESDDPLLAECGVRVLARAGPHMREHLAASQQELPESVRRRDQAAVAAMGWAVV